MSDEQNTNTGSLHALRGQAEKHREILIALEKAVDKNGAHAARWEMVYDHVRLFETEQDKLAPINLRYNEAYKHNYKLNFQKSHLLRNISHNTPASFSETTQQRSLLSFVLEYEHLLANIPTTPSMASLVNILQKIVAISTIKTMSAFLPSLFGNDSLAYKTLVPSWYKNGLCPPAQPHKTALCTLNVGYGPLFDLTLSPDFETNPDFGNTRAPIENFEARRYSGFFEFPVAVALSTRAAADDAKASAASAAPAAPDYQCNSAMMFTKLLQPITPGQIASNPFFDLVQTGGSACKITPAAVAANLIANLPQNNLIRECALSGPGFINIFLHRAYICESIDAMLAYQGKGLAPPLYYETHGQRVAIDMSSPNIAKQMHVGHLRSTIIGDALSNLYDWGKLNWENLLENCTELRVPAHLAGHPSFIPFVAKNRNFTIRWNHVGDFGTQFGMLTAYLQEAYPTFDAQMPAIADLQAFYKKSKARFDESIDFKRKSLENTRLLQHGDPVIVKAWSTICEISRTEFEKVYRDLDVRNLIEIGESFYANLMPLAVADVKNANLLLSASELDQSASSSILAHANQDEENEDEEAGHVQEASAAAAAAAAAKPSGVAAQLTEGVHQADTRKLLFSYKEHLIKDRRVYNCITRAGKLLDETSDPEEIHRLKTSPVHIYEKPLPAPVFCVPTEEELKGKNKQKAIAEAQAKSTVEFPIPMILEKSGGGYTYSTSDLASLKFRFGTKETLLNTLNKKESEVRFVGMPELKEYGTRLVPYNKDGVYNLPVDADKGLYVIDKGQSLHMQSLFHASNKLLGYYHPNKKSIEHIGFGVVLGPDGKKFKSRSGDTITLNELLVESVSRAREAYLGKRESNAGLPEAQIEMIAKTIGIAGIKYFDLKNHRLNDYTFDFDRVLDLKGNTAVYLLYAYARLASIVRKAKAIDAALDDKLPRVDWRCAVEERLIKLLARFPEIIYRVYKESHIHYLCEYCYDVSNTFTSFYEACKIIDAKPGQTAAVDLNRYALVRATQKVLFQSFEIIGIRPLDQI